MDARDPIEDGRNSFRRRAWAAAFNSLSLADRQAPLAVEDLERWAVSAYLIGRNDQFQSALERAHHAHLEAGERERAARCAFWSGLDLLLRGDAGRATGWLGRAKRLIVGLDCVEQGYLLIPVAEEKLGEGRAERALEIALEATAVGDRFEDPDLVACARHLQGRALIEQRQVREGLALLDEAMVAVTTGELSPILTGLIYCSVIETCQRVHAVGRAREWTAALAEWCAAQPEMVAFTATCLVHRAEVMQLSGAWPDAIEEARRACERPRPPASGFYRQAEIHRLRGEFDEAETAYREASRAGKEPQPGLSLLRMAQGRTEAAAAAIRRVASATTDTVGRARLLPAFIEIMLSAGDIEAAREAGRELEEIADSLDSDLLAAMASQARGEVELAYGDAEAAIGSLRRAWQLWRDVPVPYEAARARLSIARACRELGDEEGACLALDAAREEFERLGAAVDLARIDELARSAETGTRRGLTPREHEVLRLVATGKTNRSIAEELGLSEKTIERHLGNIFKKLRVHSRTAAAAYAYERDLL